MYEYRTLENTNIETLHEAFVNAFSDYQVKIDLPLWKLEQMLIRRGYAPEMSIGAFSGDILVGFILNGHRDWLGRATAYDTGTGVIPDFRKQGITTSMIGQIKEVLKNKGVHQYLLEVIQTNKSAFEIYKKQGFEITRSFSCLNMDKSKFKTVKYHKVEHVDRIDPILWDQLTNFWEVKPSWQNSCDSIAAASKNFIYSIVYIDGHIAGYGIIDRMTGDIPQLAVEESSRRKGIGASILSDLIENTEAQRISVLNVESEAEGITAFLRNSGFEDYIGQYEMIMEL